MATIHSPTSRTFESFDRSVRLRRSSCSMSPMLDAAYVQRQIYCGQHCAGADQAPEE